MELPEEAQLLRIFIGESDHYGHRPMYEVVVEEARKRGLAGATVTRAIMGFGKNSRMHTAKILRLSEDLPVVIEIVDRTDRIQAFLPVLDPMIGDGLVTLETIRVVFYRHNGNEKPDHSDCAGLYPEG